MAKRKVSMTSSPVSLRPTVMGRTSTVRSSFTT